MAKARKPEAAPSNLPTDASPGAAEEAGGIAALDRGRSVIQQALSTIPSGAGVYRMLDASGEVLYVGKAKNLRARLQSYANPRSAGPRILKMISLTHGVEVITTHTEVEALLLESNLIKRLRPRYNILLRDDKSFPYILIAGDHEWPELTKHRGARNRKGEYFGPFASAGAVNRTLKTLQRAFPLRSCADSVFENRTRPCLLYQIKRCTAPCVGRIAAQEYEQLVQQTRAFLTGDSRSVQQDLEARMQAASEALDFEGAAALRDRLRALAHIQSQQGINVQSVAEADVLAAHQEAGQTCIQVFFFRAGQNWGNRAYFPTHARDQDAAEVLGAFIGQFYEDKPPPREVLVNLPLEGMPLLAEALSVRADRRVALRRPQRGEKRRLVAHAEANAREALARRVAESSSQQRLLQALGEAFALEGAPQRIEVYDNSHVQGSDAVGAMVVAGPEGFAKNAYRKFTIRGERLAPGDDYAMMREVLTRRFARLVRAASGQGDSEDRRIGGAWPDLVLIDGGANHLQAAQAALRELGLNEIAIAAIAKGPDRNAGRERIFLPDRPPLSLDPKSPLLYFLQRLRDEAHRFAIGTHRSKRGKAMGRSRLDEIGGIGPRRKRALLHHFGSARGVEQAALADLQRVSGISRAVAQRIYDYFHPR